MQGSCASLCCCSSPAADLFEESSLGPSSADQPQFHSLSHYSLAQCNKLFSDQKPAPLPLDSLSASPFGQAQIQQAHRFAHHTAPLEIPPSATSSPPSRTPTGPASASSGCHLTSPRSQQHATPHHPPSSGSLTPRSKNLRHLLLHPGSAVRATGTAVSTPLNVLEAPPMDVDDSVQGEFFVRKSGVSHATLELQLPGPPRLRSSNSGLHGMDASVVRVYYFSTMVLMNNQVTIYLCYTHSWVTWHMCI
eukprot:1155147-Pelagomonas_calceolata.AAC.1